MCVCECVFECVCLYICADMHGTLDHMLKEIGIWSESNVEYVWYKTKNALMPVHRFYKQRPQIVWILTKSNVLQI